MPELAWVSSARGLSVVLGGTILTLWGGFRRRTLTIPIGLLLISLFTGALGLVPTNAFWAAVVTMVARTLWMPLALGSWRALLQSTVPAELQGRVFALIGSLVTLALPAGLVLAGPLADLWGVRWLFPVSGGIAVGLSVVGLLTPKIVRLEDHPAPGRDS